MHPDSIMEQVNRLRVSYRGQFQNDFEKIGRDLQQSQGSDGRKVVHLKPRKPEDAIWRGRLEMGRF